MKFIDDNLLKEVIAIREASYTPENPLTVDEKEQAVDRIKTDYINSKSRISEYRQEYIRNTLTLQKLRNGNEHFNVLEAVNEINQQANSYDDDYIYLMHMIYQTYKEKTSKHVSIGKMGEEMQHLGNQLNRITENAASFEEITKLADQIAELSIKIDSAIKEVHILSIMRAYYDRLSHDTMMSNISRFDK